MARLAYVIAPAIFAVSACTAPEISPASGSPASGRVQLAGLPLSSEARQEIAGVQRLFNTPEVQAVCSQNELEWFELGFILYAIRIEEEATAPKTRDQQQRVAMLERRRDALGGDDATVSEGCAERMQWSV